MQTIRPGSAAEWESVRELFREYWGSFGFSACFQNFEREVAGLPGAYAPPGGALVLALIDGHAAGCAALRRFDAQRGEAKRLYVRPEFRGRGVGRAARLGGRRGARDGIPRDGRRHDSADGGGACHVRSRRLRAYRAVRGGADAGSDLSAAEAVGAEFFLRALRCLRTPPAPMCESRCFPPGPFPFSSLYLCVRPSLFQRRRRRARRVVFPAWRPIRRRRGGRRGSVPGRARKSGRGWCRAWPRVCARRVSAPRPAAIRELRGG